MFDIIIAFNKIDLPYENFRCEIIVMKDNSFEDEMEIQIIDV